MSYQVKLDVFEGPFDLLLSLISKHELDVYDIPIAKIITDYLQYIKEANELNLEVASEFLVIAAILLDYKTKSLLPDEEDFEDELTEEEARSILVGRLIEYKKFKNVSLGLRNRYQTESRYYARNADVEERFAHLQPDFFADVSLIELAELMSKLEKEEAAPIFDKEFVAPPKISLEDRLKEIKERIKSDKRISFRQLTGECRNRSELVVSFLALLELYKQRIINISQAESFGDIDIEFLEESEDDQTNDRFNYT